jgi:hypothetical protein
VIINDLGLAVIKKMYGLGAMTWNFFAANHGANAYDSAASHAKKALLRKELGGDIIQNIHEITLIWSSLTNHQAIALKVNNYNLPYQVKTEDRIRKELFSFVYKENEEINCFKCTDDSFSGAIQNFSTKQLKTLKMVLWRKLQTRTYWWSKRLFM